MNSSSAEVPNDPNANNQQNDQSGNNSQNEENNNPQVPDTENNENGGEDVNPNPESNQNNNLIKDVKLPEGDIIFKNFLDKDDITTSFAYQVFNKSISSNEELNSSLEKWFEENKNKNPENLNTQKNFNSYYFLDSKTLNGLGSSSKNEFELVSYVKNSAKIITQNLNGNQTNTPTSLNKVYSFEITLTPVEGHTWVDGSLGSKNVNAYGVYYPSHSLRP